MTHKAKTYPIAPHQFIPRNPSTAHLYKLEELVHEAINRAANELARVLMIPKADWWKLALQLELHTILERDDKKATLAAAIEFIRRQGYQVDHEESDVEQ